ncbi:uncharacterized protein MELLADRAFT_106872 [Melampsora larici-populina 98AG31]|uniref:PHD-type domain-containing protein n=1 Tax=Melampsora larici-populina (strain 98AG31 / pathotype 3-4-7) TaxID=747676 RepID=F4RMX8_MELLP|nr:uncharacterized protein MELLADRAFT_106872 [Melampsora larici-populina 98AG31]EGG06194.1 hypothetical protein MELLADRAFT_106872 [Melampsora larici-populina 98AG31]
MADQETQLKPIRPSSLDQHPSDSSNQIPLTPSRLRNRTTTNDSATSEHSNPKETPSNLTVVTPAPQPLPTKKAKTGGRKSTKASAANSNGARRSSLNSKKEKRERKAAEQVLQTTELDPSSPTFQHLNPSSAKPVSNNDGDAPIEENADQEQSGSAVTRCVCCEDDEEANDVIMFQCDKCSVWQHGPCVGLYAEFPGDYFCELCRPDLHITGQYQKSSPSNAARPKRSPSLTSAPATATNRRERVHTDAASLAAFLTDAGVKPEDQVSLGGFALPIFAQTRRQSNMLVDLTPTPGINKTPHKASPYDEKTGKRASGSERSPSLPQEHLAADRESVTSPGDLPTKEGHKSKRKRQAEELEDIKIDMEPQAEEKTKRPRISPSSSVVSPALSFSTLGLSRQQASSAAAPVTGPTSAKTKRSRKNEETDESTGTVKTKASNPFLNKQSTSNPSYQATSGSQTTTNQTTGYQKRGSPTKRTREESRKSKLTEVREPTPSESITGWGLPDHLGYLSYLLPTSTPEPICLEGKSLEAPTKVKFPGKRVTIADLKKRSKHIVDYLQKVQIETCEREKRSELIQKALIGNGNSSSSNSNRRSPEDEEDGKFDGISRPVVSSKTLELMDDLSREVYHWQEKYKQ